jgi:hypothetical protein
LYKLNKIISYGQLQRLPCNINSAKDKYAWYFKIRKKIPNFVCEQKLKSETLFVDLTVNSTLKPWTTTSTKKIKDIWNKQFRAGKVLSCISICKIKLSGKYN